MKTRPEVVSRDSAFLILNPLAGKKGIYNAAPGVMNLHLNSITFFGVYTLKTGIIIETEDLIPNLLQRVLHSQIKIKRVMKM